jgi:subtilase family serine protease
MVAATVSPRSRGGTPLFEAPGPITSENVQNFYSDDQVIADATRELQKLGFEVSLTSPTTLSIRGPRKLYEDVFGVPLEKDTAKVIHGHDVEQEYFKTPDNQLLKPPENLAHLIEGVAIAHPPTYYAESPLPPLVPPAVGAYRYLLVPDDVAVVLGADQVHSWGDTGAGITVAMVDTGHYNHPFFAKHGYNVNTVILGPGAVNPTADEFGHGTGESANIFAAAPGITLQPVKMADDTVGAFQAAVTSAPKVMTNSWGYNIDYPGTAGLTPYLKTLEAAVAAAVASGIVVCFSAGNGGYGWPGSHPEVISCGGVMVNYPDLDLEASNYASSFDSTIYPGRHSPDLCGLVGRKVIDRAPLIMLPVQAGDTIDTELSAPDGAGGPADGTAPNDGWALFSGTSAASPMIAGVCALVLKAHPGLTPAQIKAKLISTATDVTAGTSAMGQPAGPGWDAATGAGLVSAKWAYLVAMNDASSAFLLASPEQQAQLIASGQVSLPRISANVASALMQRLHPIAG